MKGTGAKRNVCPGSCVSTGAKFPVAPVESAPPDPLTRGSAPGPRWGLCPQTAIIGSCSALAMVPPPTTDPFRRI